MQPLTPAHILEKYKLNFPNIDESKAQSEPYQQKISQFGTFLTQCQNANMQTRQAMMSCVKEHQASAKHYEELYSLLRQYEDTAVHFCAEDPLKSIVLTKEESQIKDKTLDVVQKYKNPFLEAALWIRGEMLDIAGMLNAIKGAGLVTKHMQMSQDKIREQQEELDKLSIGKATLKSFFKSKEGKEKDI